MAVGELLVSGQPWKPVQGGTGQSSPTANSLLQTNGASNMTLLTASVAGRIIIDNGTSWAIATVTGDVTINGSGVTVLGNIPNDTIMAGDLLATAVAAPSTPAAGKGRIYVDSTSKNIAVKDDAGVVKHGVQTITATTSQWIRSIDDAGAGAKSQPAIGDLVNIANNTLVGNNSGGSGPPLALTLAQIIAMLPGPKVGSFTRDQTLASGTQAITGVGFKPRAVIFFAGIQTTQVVSWGFDDGTTAVSWAYDPFGASGSANTWFASGSRSIEILESAANFNFASISSLDTDGFTVSWTKIGTPAAATGTIYYMAIP